MIKRQLRPASDSRRVPRKSRSTGAGLFISGCPDFGNCPDFADYSGNVRYVQLTRSRRRSRSLAAGFPLIASSPSRERALRSMRPTQAVSAPARRENASRLRMRRSPSQSQNCGPLRVPRGLRAGQSDRSSQVPHPKGTAMQLNLHDVVRVELGEITAGAIGDRRFWSRELVIDTNGPVNRITLFSWTGPESLKFNVEVVPDGVVAA